MKLIQKPLPNVEDAVNAILMMFEYREFNYGRYSPQMVTTNEIYQIYDLKNYVPQGAQVLTVSASGEQPLFFKLYGAKDVITFDISYNSYLLTSLKIAALCGFKKPGQYKKFLEGLTSGVRGVHLLRVPEVQQILQYLDETEKKHLVVSDMMGLPVFVDDISCQYYDIAQSDYTELRQLVKTPFPFIWTNITELDNELGDKTFDCIYYSNILNFISEYEVVRVLSNTKKRINPNGKLFLVVSEKDKDLMKYVVDGVYGSANWNKDFIKSETEDIFNLFVIQRKGR